MKTWILALALFFATNAIAQDDVIVDAATRYLDHPVQQKLIDDMFSPEAAMANLGLVGGQIPEDDMEVLAGIVSEELTAIRPEFRNAMIEGMARTFTLEEIEALNAFYSSDVGASAMSKMTPYMQTAMAELGPTFQTMQMNIMRRVQEHMSK